MFLTLSLLVVLFLGLVASYRDIQQGWIPDWSTVCLGIAGIAWAHITGGLPENVLSALLLGGLACGLRRWFRAKGMGWGDIKLLGAAGVWVPLEKIPVLLIACGLLGVISHILWTVVKHLDRKRSDQWQNTFPFAPSIYGALLWYLWAYF